VAPACGIFCSLGDWTEGCLCVPGGASDVSARLSRVPWDGRHALEVNRIVTATYIHHARWWQQVLDPGTNASSTGAWPTWFAFAPYASREVGRGLSLLSNLQQFHAFTGLRQAIAVFNVESIAGPHCGPLGVCWGHIAAILRRAAAVVLPAPGRSLATAVGLLEHGNRLICEHVAGASERYMLWRQARGPQVPITPELVLAEFRLQPSSFRATGVHPSVTGTDPAAARRLFEAAMRLAEVSDPRALLAEHRCVEVLVVAFAMWESAGQAFRAKGTSREHRRRLELANALVAYCEQAEAAAPAFRPSGGSPHGRASAGDNGTVAVLPGEVPRDELMALLTSSVRLPLRRGTWTLDRYARKVLGELRYYRVKNWGLLRDRFLPILDAFRMGNELGPSAVWPLPSPDPLSQEDAPACAQPVIGSPSDDVSQHRG